LFQRPPVEQPLHLGLAAFNPNLKAGGIGPHRLGCPLARCAVA
jgi:hypothetical protein